MPDRKTESRIDEFLAKYSPEIEPKLRASRERLRTLFPNGYELVYDNYNALVFGISATGKTSDAFISVAGYPRWVTLFFLQGSELDDPEGLLEGTGKTVRSIRLATPDVIDQAEVKALIERASARYSEEFAEAPPLRTVIRSVSEKQRPRRP